MIKKLWCLALIPLSLHASNPLEDLPKMLERVAVELSIKGASAFLHSPLGDIAISAVKDEMRKLSLEELNEVRVRLLFDQERFAQVQNSLAKCTPKERASVKELAAWLKEKLCLDMPRDVRNLVYDLHNLMLYTIGKIEYPEMSNKQKIEFFYLTAKAYTLGTLHTGTLAIKSRIVGDPKRAENK